MGFRPLKRVFWRYIHQPFPENLLPGKKLPFKYQQQIDKRRKQDPFLEMTRLKTDGFKTLQNWAPKALSDSKKGGIPYTLSHSSWVEIERFTPFFLEKSPILPLSAPSVPTSILHTHPFKTKESSPYCLFESEILKGLFSRLQKGPKVKIYKAQLLERKKLSLLYGNLSKRALEKTIQKAQASPGLFHERLLTLLESRVDVVLYRSGLFASLGEARHWIRQKRVLVNGSPLTFSSSILKPGDVLRIHPDVAPQLVKLLSQRLEKSPLNMKESFSLASSLASQSLNFERERGGGLSGFQHVKEVFTFFSSLGSRNLHKKETLKKGENSLGQVFQGIDSLLRTFPKIWGKSGKKGGVLERIQREKGSVRTHFLLNQENEYEKKERNQLQPIKPLHLEVCFRQLVVILLFPPQKILFPTHLSFSLIQRSFH